MRYLEKSFIFNIQYYLFDNRLVFSWELIIQGPRNKLEHFCDLYIINALKVIELYEMKKKKKISRTIFLKNGALFYKNYIIL